ncbi:hypothetical protein VT84_14800 [Gemmata sp. SH-PL17]|nr:hypothetical protein VT84_14800 [Gemmata sp. SH-PL17]
MSNLCGNGNMLIPRTDQVRMREIIAQLSATHGQITS